MLFRSIYRKEALPVRSEERWGQILPELADNYEGMEQKGLKMEFFAKTDQGKMRKMNQDFLFATGDALGKFPNLFLLADGMGGHRAGDFASRYLVESLTTLLKQTEELPLVRSLEKAIQKMNLELLRLSQSNIHLQGMGSTLVTAFVDGNSIVFSNVGDSRAYLFQRNRLRQVTRDHSYVEEMIQRGKMIRGSEEYQKSKNMITRAIGVEKYLEVDFFEEEWEEGDLFFLCSDGLSNMVDQESMVQILKDDSSLEEKGEALITLANINGGKDNIALILVRPGRKEQG